MIAIALLALLAFGVSEEDRMFLGFPDGELSMLRDRFLAHRGLAYTSPFTGVRQPPVSQMLIPDLQYTATISARSW